MEVFNTRRLTQRQRFGLAVAVGIIAAIVLGILSGKISLWIGQSTGLGFAIINIGAGYLLGMTIQKIGRGVQAKFSILGGVLGVFMVLISEVIALGFPIYALFMPEVYRLTLKILLDGGVNSIITLIYNAIAVYTAYGYSRFL